MVDTGCLDALTAYADFLNNANAPTFDSSDPNAPTLYSQLLWPHPLMWGDVECTGAPTPNMSDIVTSGQTLSAPGVVKSFFVPSYWQLQLGGVWYPAQPSPIPQLINSANIGTGGQAHVLTGKPDRPHEVYTAQDWVLARCTNQLPYMLGRRFLTAYEPQSPECDQFVKQYCEQEKQRIGQYPRPTCNCLADEETLRETFCQPSLSGNPQLSASCQDTSNNGLHAYMPATCFGKSCSEAGYRFDRMVNIKCNEQLCQQIIDLSGHDITLSGQTAMYCGNTDHATQRRPDGSTATPDNSAPPAGLNRDEIVRHGISPWLTAALVIAGFLLLMTMPLLGYILYRTKGILPAHLLPKVRRQPPSRPTDDTQEDSTPADESANSADQPADTADELADNGDAKDDDATINL